MRAAPAAGGGGPLGALLYVRGHRAASLDARMELSGVVVGKRIELPGGKRMVPVRFIVDIRDAMQRRSVDVDHATYLKAAAGMTLRRDHSGKITLSR